jgi:Raf kinase inhibitor-like YbhB/YbcL family protein
MAHAQPRLNVTSAAFNEGARIPERYTADGHNVSPPLRWTEPPENARSIAVLCEDPDAPSGTFVHWIAWSIEADRRELAEGVAHTLDADGLRQGENGFGMTGYGGPKPPRGNPHHYLFHVYALDYRPDLAVGANRADFDRAINGHVLAEGTLIGVYGR